VDALLRSKASLDDWSTGKHNYGKTALFYAITRCRDEMVVHLLSHGARTKFVNNKGQTPYSLAVSHLENDTVALLCAKEEKEKEEWINFRASHSDGLLYGDLDARFIDEKEGRQDGQRSLETNEGEVPSAAEEETNRRQRRIDEHIRHMKEGKINEIDQSTCLLSTTYESRRGNFIKNNPHMDEHAIAGENGMEEGKKSRAACIGSNWIFLNINGALSSSDRSRVQESFLEVMREENIEIEAPAICSDLTYVGGESREELLKRLKVIIDEYESAQVAACPNLCLILLPDLDSWLHNIMVTLCEKEFKIRYTKCMDGAKVLRALEEGGKSRFLKGLAVKINCKCQIKKRGSHKEVTPPVAKAQNNKANQMNKEKQSKSKSGNRGGLSIPVGFCCVLQHDDSLTIKFIDVQGTEREIHPKQEVSSHIFIFNSLILIKTP